MPSNNLKDLNESSELLIEEILSILQSRSIEESVSEDVVLSCMSSLKSKYSKPLGRLLVHTTTVPRKNKVAFKKTVKWFEHPGSAKYAITKDFMIDEKYPIKELNSEFIVGTIDEDGSYLLTKSEHISCAKGGYKSKQISSF